MTSPLSGIAAVDTKYTKLYNNPTFDYLTEMLPKNIKEMFKWSELVVNSAPILSNGIKKLINYPLTDFIYKTDSEKVRKDTKDLLEKKLKMRSHLIDLGIDYYAYGNVFRSVYFPFDRFLKCSVCGRETNIEYAKYKIIRNKTVLNCECDSRRAAEIIDKDSQDIKRVRLVSWDPHAIDVSYNVVTSISTYYYSLPESIRKGIAYNDPTTINTLPKLFLDAHFQNKPIKFGNNFFHFKAPGLSGYASGWGIPPLLSALKPYLFIAILRKASEAIGLEHITPKNILYPQGTTNDPTMFSSMARWKEEIEFAIKKWRQDPNHVMLAPYPTGTVNIGSQGRALMPTREIQDARQEMAMALDVPLHFLTGEGAIEKSTVALRILENQLTPYVEQLVDYVNWVIGNINAKYDTNYCEIDLTPFTLVDDVIKRQILLQTTMNQATSTQTLLESLDIDPEEEKEKQKKEQLDKFVMQKEVEKDIAEHEENLVNQTQAETTSNTIPQYNQQKLMAHAQQVAQQLIVMPYEQRRSYMAQLQNEDYVMWAMVSKMVESMHEQQAEMVPPQV
jgi:hypothetical protein